MKINKKTTLSSNYIFSVYFKYIEKMFFKEERKEFFREHRGKA